MDISRDEFATWVAAIRADFAGVHARLDVLNGRTRTNETDIAVLKDRDNQDSEQGRDMTALVTGWGAIVVALAVALIDYFKHRVGP